MQTLNLGFLASHSGSNMQAIINNVLAGNLNANLRALISNNSKSGAIERAKTISMPYYHVSEKTYPNEVAEKIIEIFDEHKVDTIILAGYMKILDKKVIEHFGGRVLNIHPALLPKFGGEGMYGINVHKAVIEAKEAKSGATIHLVSPEYDRGRILAQSEVEVLSDDTPDSLAERVLASEHKLYSDTLRRISLGEIVIP